jgi:hypothetical protein
MKSLYDKVTDEQGSALVVALVILVAITVIGIAASTTSEIEIQVAGNERDHKAAFYAAEAARAYVAGTTALYGPANTKLTAGRSFPNDEDPTEMVPLAPRQAFNGFVEYLGSSAPPRGSGYQAGKFKAHRYQMSCNGFGPANSEAAIRAAFYRIGF